MRALSARAIRVSLSTVASLALLAGLVACSQSSDSKGGLGNGSGSGSGAGSGSGSGAGPGSGAGAGSSGSKGPDVIVTDAGGGVEPLDAGCASHTEEAKFQPVHLVVLLDRSGSMAEMRDGQNSRTVKWDPVVTALKGFFDDPTTSGLSASMIMFPARTQAGGGGRPGGGFGGGGFNNTRCAVDDYTTPVVPITELPSPEFGAALDAATPPNGFGTPTYPALAGAIKFAQEQRVANPDTKFVILMVTDGEPAECGDENTIEAAAAEAAAVAGEIPTYVIGVGDALDNLNAIAQAGGTGSAILVAVEDPAKTQGDLTAAINQIRNKELSCNISLPLPPAGQVFDPSRVNVSFTPQDGEPEVLFYDQDCVAGGWRYNDPANPTQIALCESTCGAVTANQANQLNIILGCATAVPK